MSSIPQRFGRIAMHKLSEFKRRIEEMDDDALRELETEQQKNRETDSAKRELDDAIASPTASASRPSDLPTRPRTPEQIATGSRTESAPLSSRSMAQPVHGSDPLPFHYQLLGVENGADFVTVQGAYKKLAARCDPARFPANSDEAKQAAGLRERLDASYKVLREALDFTARRFDLLEFDPANAPAAPHSSKG